MDSIMIETVNSLLDKYIGGEIFFDELDGAIRTDDKILKELFCLANEVPKEIFWSHRNDEKWFDTNLRIVVSGKTGIAIKEWGWDADLVLPGGLRKIRGELPDFGDQIERGKFYLFVDDSYFSGRTEECVHQIIDAGGGYFAGTVVAYDGCYEKRDNVWALYSYYDHYDLRGNKL